MKRKSFVVALTAAMMAAALVVGGTLAYFTDTDNADNVFTVGNVDITLTEPNWEGEGSKDAPEAYPGEALAKDPTVTNDGKNPCFVRIKVTGWDCLGADNMITYKTKYQAGQLGAGWEEYNGYYYWMGTEYVVDETTGETITTGVLPVDAKTTALFDQIVIPTTVTNGFNGQYDLVVTAEAVQAQGAKTGWNKPAGDPMYPGVLQMGVEDIADWFGTCGL